MGGPSWKRPRPGRESTDARPRANARPYGCHCQAGTGFVGPLKGALHNVPRNRLSLDPAGRVIALAPDGTCLVQNTVGFQPHRDRNLGMVRYRGRQHLVTHATSFVRDGKDFVAFLPRPEPCIVRKPTFGTDADLAAVDFAGKACSRSAP